MNAAADFARRVLRGLSRRVRTLHSDARRWLAIARTPPTPNNRPQVFYGHDRVPGLGDLSHGGMVKFQRLAAVFPNEPRAFNLVYLGSSSLPHDMRTLIALARRRGAPVAWNQNGVAYAGWHGPGWEKVNARLAYGYLRADHVFFQSEFCRLGAERFLGRRDGPSELLYNPVDTEAFRPLPRRPDRPLTLLLGGTQYQRYRFETALDTTAELIRRGLEVRLLVTGALNWTGEKAPAPVEAAGMIATRQLDAQVEFIGAYTQAEAPNVMRRADLLLHTKYNDPCPGLVLEAMASGLPIVYSASGGVPELVGPDAGVGVPAPLAWERDHPPTATALADAVEEAAGRREKLGAAARKRAVANFDLKPWITRHEQVFTRLIAR